MTKHIKLITLTLIAAGFIFRLTTSTVKGEGNTSKPPPSPTVKTSNDTKLSYEEVSKLIKPSVVKAKIIEDISGFKKGETVEIIYGEGTKTFRVKNNQNKLGWVERKFLEIPKDPVTNINQLKDDEIELYINNQEFAKSSTNQFIWIDIDRQKVYILKGSFKKWKVNKIMNCATGLNIANTPRGMHKISDKGKWFYSYKYKQGGKYWVRFYGDYLFHSVPYNYNQTKVVDTTISKRASHGCVRLAVQDSKWIYDNIKRGTGVWSN